ncbi:MAG: hypothetical protein QOF78_1184 [Phycisphaerales bacterium]|jgi:predicted DNA-binding antitoxin AbrB/MazE fold protein|nr:hypothetical protein [Phycisphaerales bacterium]
MNRTIKATYEGGVLRPAEPLALKEGEVVSITVAADGVVPPGGGDPQEIARSLAEIAKMPLEPGGKVFSNREHDRILYGWKK